jgi:GNAT superfamily N-acetyltransferase
MLEAPTIRFDSATEADLEDLVALRIAAMRPSLERIGRFDPVRARERLLHGLLLKFTRHIVWRGERVGFLAFKRADAAFELDHLYIRPGSQGLGIGGAALAELFREADAAGLPIQVSVLRDSDSNRFYLRHGFVRVGTSEWDVHYVRAHCTL